MPGALRSDAEQFVTAVAYQLRSYLRTWRFLGLLLFVAGISAVVLGLRAYQGVGAVRAAFPTASAFLAGYLGNVGSAVIISAAFLGGDALAVDLAGGPGYLMLTLPVRRRTLLAGRYVAAALTVTAVALVYYAFALAGSIGFYDQIPPAVLVSLGAALLFGLSALAVAFFFSSFFKSPSVAIIASLLILILGFPIATAISSFVGGEPWYSLDYGSGIISNVLVSDFQHHKTLVVGGGPGGVTFTLQQWSPYLWEGVVIIAAYLAVFLVLTYVLYQYREVKG